MGLSWKASMGAEEKNSELVKADHISTSVAAERQPLIGFSSKLRSNPALTKLLYAVCVIGILAEPFIILPVRMMTFYTLAAWFGMFWITIFHELGSPWIARLDEVWKNFYALMVCTVGSSKTNTAPNFKLDEFTSLVRSIAANRFLKNAIALFMAVYACSFVERSIIYAFTSGGMLWSLTLSGLLSLCFPISAIVALKLSQDLKRLSDKQLNVAVSTNNIERYVNSFLVTRGSYLGAYAGICTFIALFSFNALGGTLAAWLHTSLVDANIASNTNPDKIAIILTSSICFFVLFLFVSRIAVRLSASFQLLANRVVVFGDSLIEALIETAEAKSTVVHLPEGYVHFWNIISTFSWLVFCYLCLFSLVAFCPPPLGDAIRNWLHASFRDAYLDLNPATQMNVRLFAASIVAGYGAVPVAIMSSVFLPRRKPRTLILSKQGILCPGSVGNLAGFSPLKYWDNLKEVSISGKRENDKVLKLTFGFCDSIKLKINELDASELTELLSAADEYAPRCKFDSTTIALRLKMIDQTKASFLIESNKFSSTIFSPLNSGDFLNENKYRIVRKLAGKALSTVYLARDNVSYTHVVIKEYVLPTNALQRERMLITFEREFKLLSSLNHKGIAQVKEMFEQADARYLVIEYIEGDDLRSIVERRGGRNEATVRRWAKEICKIMIFLHEQNPIILHRDLTPDNLMEDKDGRIKLIDFGAAHQFIEGVTGTLIGKQCYIAPEQLRGQPSIQSDIYSFACTLFFLITGKDPVALKQSELDPDFPVSGKMRELIKACTHLDETQRPDSFKTILDILENDRPTTLKDPVEKGLRIEEAQ